MLSVLVLAVLGLALLWVLFLVGLRKSPAFRGWVRQFNKRSLNPLVLSRAGRPGNLYAVVHHVGRRSGQPYATPVRVRPTPEGFIVPLPYGRDVDWCRNVLAAGSCVISWDGRDYPVGEPEVMKMAATLPRVTLPRVTLPRWRARLWSGLLAHSPLGEVPCLWVRRLPAVSEKTAPRTGALAGA